MKKSYRFIAVLSSLIICVAAFSACGDDNNSKNAIRPFFSLTAASFKPLFSIVRSKML